MYGYAMYGYAMYGYAMYVCMYIIFNNMLS